MIKERKLFKQLNSLSLKEVKPRLDWVKSNRDILLSQIKAQQIFKIKKNSLSGGEIFRSFIPNFIWFKKLALVAIRPVGSIILIGVLALGGGVFTVNASFNSLPGDALYPIKLTAEKVQLTLNTDERAKLAMEIEFAGRRIEELNRVNAGQDKGKEENIKIPLEAFAEEISNINARLESLNQGGEVEEVVRLANLVDDKTEDYTNLLLTQKGEVPQAVKENVKDAIIASQKAGERAVGIMIENHSQMQEVSKEMITRKVEDKINKAEEKNNQLEEGASNPAEAKKVIDDAKGFLENGDLASAFGKVKESTQLTKNAEELIEKTNETAVGSEINGTAGVAGAADTNITNGNSNSNINIEQPTKVEGGAIANENISVSGSLLYEEKK
jgi:hypothetical protein